MEKSTVKMMAKERMEERMLMKAIERRKKPYDYYGEGLLKVCKVEEKRKERVEKLLPEPLKINRFYKEEMKQKAKALFKEVATTHFMDTRDELSELDSIMLNLKDYEIFYFIVLKRDTRIEIEEEIMEELAEELGRSDDFIIGYERGKPVMIMSSKYYKEEIEGNEDNLYEYEGIEFVEKLEVKKRMLAGETESIESSIVTEVYQEIKEEIKERAKALFKDVATTDYMDIRDELEELDSIIQNVQGYEEFYYDVLNREDRVEMEEQIMEELAEELRDREGYVIGYEKGKAVMIVSSKYYKEEIGGNEDNPDDYEGIDFGEKTVVRKRMLAGETVDSSIYEEVYQVLKEEVKERAKELFVRVATIDYIDTRYKLEELDNMTVEDILHEYSEFYYEVLEMEDKIEMEEEIMEELEEEMGYNEEFVIGYSYDKPVVIVSKSCYKEHFLVDEDLLESYEDIDFREKTV